MKTRVWTTVKLFKDDQVVLTTSMKARKRLILRIEAVPASEWNRGVCRITYNKEKDYWNEFEFTTIEQFHETYVTDTEPELIEAFS